MNLVCVHLQDVYLMAKHSNSKVICEMNFEMKISSSQPGFPRQFRGLSGYFVVTLGVNS